MELHEFRLWGSFMASSSLFIDLEVRLDLLNHCSILLAKVEFSFHGSYTIFGVLYMVDFRVEDMSVLVPSMKTFLGIGGHFDLKEMYDTLPIKVLTFFLAIGFVFLHGLSGKLNGGKMWLARRHPRLKQSAA